MPNKIAALAVFCAALLCAAGCTKQQLYDSGLAWQRTQCNKHPTYDERARCLDSTTISYDDYQRQVREANGK